MTAISFTDEPYAVRLLNAQTEEELGEVCPLLAVDGDKGLIVRQREMFWWPLNLIRVVLQPEPVEAPAEGEVDLPDEAPRATV